jgi:hypothetical protein
MGLGTGNGIVVMVVYRMGDGSDSRLSTMASRE